MATQPSETPTGTSVAVRDNSEVGKFARQLEDRARDIQMALPAGIPPAKFQRTILTAVAQNPALLQAERGSLILACYKAAQDGLVPDGREAALVTFNQRFKDPADNQWKSRASVQYMPMVYGLRKKILQAKDASGMPVVSALQVGVVYRVEVEKGYFLWERGSDPEVQHRPMLEITLAEAADENIVAAYSIATMRDGTRSCEVMRRFEIDQVRQMSQTGAEGREYEGKKIAAKGPWVDWFAEMAKKTVMRRHAKTLPMSSDVIAELGGEDDELLAGRSAALTLGSTAPDGPVLITDESGDQIDSGTGEIVGNANDDQPPVEEQAKPARGKGKAKAEPEKAQDAASAKDEKAEPEPEPERDDQTGVTKDPNEAVAERLLGEFANAKNEKDLKKLWDGSELDRAPMSGDLHSAVQNGYMRHEKRLREPETAQ